MKFKLIPRSSGIPAKGVSTIYLHIDHWNDFSFMTMFDLSLDDEKGIRHDIGQVKIGFKGQDKTKDTYATLDQEFISLPKGYFSLGMGDDYYKNLAKLSKEFRVELLTHLNDMAYDSTHLNNADGEEVFSVSLLRDVSLSVIKGQFSRILAGKPGLTDFKFNYIRPEQQSIGGLKLRFNVIANSLPSTNVHAVIGRNGAGKTTLLNGMIESIVDIGNSLGKFTNSDLYGTPPISKDYFSSLVSVSFSAFDPFKPPKEQSDPSEGACYFYIGLQKDDGNLSTLFELNEQCEKALNTCFRSPGKTKRWLKAMKSLGSDDNFSEMKLEELEAEYKAIRSSKKKNDTGNVKEKYSEIVGRKLSRLSSGHAVVFLTVSRLVAAVEEKTLVLIDEPESHLHPPLLSAFIRALSELMYDRNGVAILATHSPVVLQEVPRSCVWKISRSGKEVSPFRPANETFGENVGVLTRDIFGHEVVKSGFHQLLLESVEKGNSYEEILENYDCELGQEARSILKALVLDRDRGLSV
jgi:predicted ATPase